MSLYWLRPLVVAAVVGLLPSLSHAGAKIVDPFSDTAFTTFRGAVETNANGNVDPFVVQVYSGGNECVRIAVTRQNADLTATLVAPDGNSWFDDDSNGSLRPLLRVITSSRGWYPLVISSFAGFTATTDFTLVYGRFPPSSSQCAGASARVAGPDASKIKPVEGQP
jgi:hypothetical protein